MPKVAKKISSVFHKLRALLSCALKQFHEEEDGLAPPTPRESAEVDDEQVNIRSLHLCYSSNVHVNHSPTGTV